MKIHLYKNEPRQGSRPLVDVIDQVKQLAIVNREKLVDGKMDFTFRRTTNGPGLSHKGQATQDFALATGDGFGEQTAVIYAPDKDYVAIQYNHFGPRAASIAGYFGYFHGHQNSDFFDWNPVIDEDVYARFINSAQQTKLHFKIDASTLTDAMVRNNVAFSAVQDLREGTSAGMVEITISYGNDSRGGSLSRIVGLARNMLDNSATKGLKATIKEQTDSKAEVLDLFNHRLCQEIEDTVLVQTQGLRYTFRSRINPIEIALTQWLQSR